MANFSRRSGLKVRMALIAVLALVPAVGGAEPIPEVESLREELKAVRRSEQETNEKLRALERKLDALTADRDAKAASNTQALPTAAVSGGSSKLRLLDVSLNGLFAAGWSDADGESLSELQGGGHDPKRRGFTVQNVELSLTGAVDPYLTGETHIVFQLDPDEGETLVELEEAFVTTQSLPYGFQLEAGHFFTEFGILNPNHPHAWDWLDQPVINTRIFGPDGMRAPGARLGWLTPLPWYSQLHFGVQNANGETVVSFLANDEVLDERPVGGAIGGDRSVNSLDELVYLTRFENFWELDDELSAKLGVSGLLGPNPTGDDSETYVYGADLKLKWLPNYSFRGWPFVTWESEYLRREYHTAPFALDSASAELGAGESLVGGDTLTDQGFYTQLLWGFRSGWATGMRVEHAFGSGDSVLNDSEDPLRDSRYRLSPMLAWYPSEFSRVRIQYNYDDAEHLETGDAHSFWLGWEILYGAHPAHQF